MVTVNDPQNFLYVFISVFMAVLYSS